MNPSNVSNLRRHKRSEGDEKSVGSNLSDYEEDIPSFKTVKNSLAPPLIVTNSNSRSTPANINQASSVIPDPGLSSIRAPSSSELFHDAADVTYEGGSANSPLSPRRRSLYNKNDKSPAPVPPVRSVSFASNIPNLPNGAPTEHFHRPRSGSWSGVNESEDGEFKQFMSLLYTY